jgi:hypothetical protein
MQSGSGWRVIDAASVGLKRRVRRIGVLVLGLALSGCVGAGQIAGLSEGRRATVAVESVEGAPPAVVHRFVTLLNDEAAARGIIIASPSEANYRVRGYLAAQRAEGAATSVSWVLDVYGPDRQRTVRFSGEQKATGPTWAWAQVDDETLRRMARMGMERLAAFVGTAPSVTTAAVAASPPAAPPPSTTPFGSLDDWTPEASGIFRILRGEPARTATAAAGATPAPAAAGR